MVRSSAMRLIAVLVFLAAVTPLGAATFSSSQTGNWSSAATWGGAGVPGAGDTATVNGGHVVTLDTAVTVATLNLSGGQITGTNSLNVTTVFNWNSGVLSGASTMTIASGTVGGGGTLDARSLTNNGSFSFSAGNYFYMQNGASVTNSGTIDFLSDGSGIFQSGSLGSMTITNAGTIKKSGGTGSSTIQMPIIGQSGSHLLAQSGTLNIAAVNATGSTFDASSGAILDFNTSDTRSLDTTCTVSGAGTIYWAGGTNNVSATYNVTGVTKNAATTNIAGATSSGDLVVVGGTLTLNNATTLSIANLSMQSGTLAGSAPITLTGSSQTWTGGTIAGTGLLTIPSGTTVNFNGYVYFDTRSISNAGTLSYSSNYYSYFYNGAVLTNSGTVNFQGDGGFYIGSGSPSVTNSGTIEKTGGTGQGGIQVSLTSQSGSQILIQSGTILFGNVAATGTTLSVSSGAMAQFYYTTSSSFDSGSTINGAGTVYFSAGTNSVNASYNITGATNANGGTTTIGTNNVTSVGSMTVGGGTLTVNNSSVPTTGTITVQAGTLTLNYTSTLSLGTLNMQGGILAGTAPISLTGTSMTWTGGTIAGSGQLTIPTGTSIAINGFVYFDTRTVSNAGSITYSSNYYSYLYNGATFSNSGTVTFQGDGGLYIGSGSPSVINSGTITKSGGTGQGGIQVALTAQSGSQLQVQSGTMLLGNVTATGAAFSVSSGATMQLYYTTTSSFDAASSISGAGNVIFAAGTNTVSGTYNVTGSTKGVGGTNTISSISALGDLGVSGGTLTLNGASSINIPTLTMQGGTLNGTLPLSISGTSMSWSSGIIGGSGQLTIPIVATITLTGVTLDARPVSNAGTINFTSNGAMYMQNNSVLTNSGTIDLQGDSSVYFNGGASTAVLNSGTIKKSAGTSGSSFNVPLTLQSGSQLQVQANILYAGNITSTSASVSVPTGATLYFYYTTTSSFDAPSSISGAGTVQFGAGTNTVNAAYNITGATKSSGGTTTLSSITSTGDITMTGGTLTLNSGSPISVPTLAMQGGTINGTAPIALTGSSMTWSGGTVGGSGTLSIPSLTTISINGGSPSLDGRPVSNGGTINLVSTYVLYMLNNAVLTNSGTIDFQGDSGIVLNSVAGTTAINNNGTIKKSAASTSGSTISVQLNLNAGSQFQIQAGTFYFGNITAAGATMTVASGTIAYMYYTSTATFDAASTISGAGTVQWYAGTNTVSGTYNITGATKCASITTIGTSITNTGDILMSSGTLTLNNATALSVPTLSMQGGTLNGTAPINITGSAQTWSGGIIGGTGALSIPNTTTTTVNGGFYIDTRTVTNAGTINLVANSYTYMQNNGVLSNSGMIDLQGDGNLYQSGPIGTTSIVNSGTIKKSGGTSGSSISVPLTLQSGGQLLIQTSIGYLGNITSTGGTLNISSGATAYLYYTASATFDAASTINGGGTLQNGAGTNSIAGTISDSIFMSGATLSINSATTQSIPALTMQGGTLNGSGNLAVTNAAMTWIGGTLGGSGTLSIPVGTVVTISGSITLDTRTLNNAGTLAITGSNYMYLQNNGVLNNSGTVDLQGDGNMYLSGAAGTTMVNDSGTIKKSAGTSSAFTAPLTLQSGGQFLVQSGTVYFGNITGSGGTLNMSSGATAYLYYTTAATFDASTTISGSGTLNNGAGTNSIAGTITSPLLLSGGTLSINSASTQSIPVLTMTGGILNGTANLAVTSAAMTWNGGAIAGSGTFSIPSGTTVTISGVPFLDTRAFTNAGTIAFTGSSYFYLQNGATLTNSGTIDFQSDNAIYLNTGSASVTNNGLLTKSGGTGFATVNIPFTNSASGTIRPLTGTISFSNLTENGTLSFPIAGVTSFGKVASSNALVLGGTLTATTTSGYTPVNGTTFQVLTFPSASGAFATKNLTYSGGGQFTDSYTSNAMTLTAGNANCTAVPSNAVAWYRAEGDTTDSAGVNLASISGGVTYATGEAGQAFSFDGVNGSVNAPMSSSLQLTNVTIEFWMKGDPTNPLNTCCQGVVGAQMYAVEIDGSGLSFGVSTDGGATTPFPAASTNISTNTWHHVAGTYDGSTISLYVDGALASSTPHSGAISSNGGFLSIGSEDGRVGSCNGCNTPNRYFKGLLDEVTIYNRALSASEIQTIYNVASAGKCYTPSTPTITGFSPSSGGVGTSVTITGTNFVGTSAVKFNGTPAASFTINSATQITAVVPSGTTTGPISVTTTGGVATSSSSFTFTCAPPPATITAPSVVCGNATNVGASVTATGGATYSWTISNGVITSGQGTNAITFNPGASGTVALGVTVTDATSCSANGNANVTINPAPSSAITAPPSICTTSTGNASVTATGGASYNWSITNGNITGGTGTNAITFTPGSSGNVVLSITVISTNGCSSSSNATIPINTAPSATITAPPSVCASASASAGVTTQAGATYNWSVTNGSITSGAGTSAIVFTAGASGTVNVSVTVSNGGCSASSSVSLPINAVPAPVITGPNTTCAGSPVTLDAGAGFSSYLWSTGATTQTISVSPTATTNYSVTVTNANGCSGTSSYTVSVNPLPPSTITAPASICNTATGNASVTATSGATYNWSILNGNITGGNGTNAITFTPGGSGNVTLAITVTSSSGCSSNSTATVPITAAPSATITAPAAACASNVGNASVPAQGGATYSWSITNGTINAGAGTNGISFTAGASGSVTLNVTVSNGGCTASSSVTIPINAVPTPSITGPSATCAGSPIVLDAGAGFASYFWSTGATTQTISVAPSGNTTYSVTVTNAGGCTATTSHPVTVTPAPSANISAPSSVQPGSSNNGASVPATAGATYSWTISNGSITSGAGTHAISFTAGSSGSVSLNVTVTNGSCSASGHAAVPIAATAADLAISMTASPNGVNAGSPVAFTITVTNNGPANASNIAVNSTISSAAATFAGASSTAFSCGSPAGQTLSCTAPSLPVGNSATLTITYNATTNDPSLSSTATVSSSNDPNAGNNTAGAAATVTQPQPAGNPCANPTATTLASPADQATLSSSSVHFSWNAVAGASYRLWISVNGAPFAAAGDTTGTSMDVNISSGSVEWYVETLFTGCSSVASAHRTFTIPQKNNCASNGVAANLAPSSDVSSATVTFSWSPVAGATGYEVWLSLNGGTATLFGSTNTTSLTHDVPPGPIEWFVLANFDGCPQTESAHAQFSYNLPVQCSDAHPVAITPLNNSLNLFSPVTFSWKEVTGAASYKVWISVNGAAYSVLGTTQQPHLDNAAVPSGNINWYVEAIATGCPTNKSTVSSFSVIVAPTGCPALTAPLMIVPASASSGVKYTISWQPVGGATSYLVASASNTSFTNASIAPATATHFDFTDVNNTSQPLAKYFRVRAVATCQTDPGPFSDTSAVVILPSTTAGKQLQGSAPADQTQIITYTIPLDASLAGLTFSATPNQPWITVTPSSGIVPAGGLSLLVKADTTGLPVGTSLGGITITTSSTGASSKARTTASSSSTVTTVSVSLVTPSLPTSKSTPPPDALIIPAVAHANGLNSTFQSDVRVTNTSALVMKYQVTFTPSGDTGITDGKQTTLDIDPGKTIALDDVLGTWFTNLSQNVVGVLEIRPLTSQSSTSTNASSPLAASANALSTFASSRTFNVTPNGTYGQYIPAIPFASFIGGAKDAVSAAPILSLQQISQSSAFRTNLGFVEGSGQPASLLVSVFDHTGVKITDFPLQLAAGQHTQFSLGTQGVQQLTDGRVEVKVLSPTGKVTTYASVLDNQTNDPLLVSPVNLAAAGSTTFVVPGVADLSNGLTNWRTDMRIFNASSQSVDTTLTFYSQNGGDPKSVTMTVAPNEVKDLDSTLASTFGITNDGGTVHITTAQPASLIATARTYNQTSNGTYGQFIPAVTPADAAGVGSRPLQLLQLEESDRYRSNVGIAEVNGKPVKVQISVVPPDGRVTGIAELDLGPNEFRQLNSMLRSFGLNSAYNQRVSVKVISGEGRVTAYASVIDQTTQDPTYVPAQ